MANGETSETSGDAKPVKCGFVSAGMRLASAIIRRIPLNRRIKYPCVANSLRLKRYRLDFKFRCPRIGVTWSAEGFPDILTRHMLFEGMYQEDVLVALKNLVRPGDTVFDVGGHHGLMAVISGRAAGASGRVVTFEPNPAARQFLEQHVALNGLGNVRVESLALSDRRGEIPFYVQTGDVTWNSTIIQEFGSGNQAIMVQTLTLDEYVDRTGCVPAIVKVDTEGSEMLVLKGASETLKQHRPSLIMEFNPASAQAAHTTVAQYVDFLKSESYRLFVLQRNVLGYYQFDRQEPFDEQKHASHHLANVVAIPQKR